LGLDLQAVRGAWPQPFRTLQQTFPGDLPDAITGVGAEALAAVLDELEWERWLAAEPRGYGFVARIVRDVVDRDMVVPGQRRRILEAAGRSPAA